jgi:hypothetical protein
MRSVRRASGFVLTPQGLVKGFRGISTSGSPETLKASDIELAKQENRSEQTEADEGIRQR